MQLLVFTLLVADIGVHQRSGMVEPDPARCNLKNLMVHIPNFYNIFAHISTCEQEACNVIYTCLQEYDWLLQVSLSMLCCCALVDLNESQLFQRNRTIHLTLKAQFFLQIKDDRIITFLISFLFPFFVTFIFCERTIKLLIARRGRGWGLGESRNTQQLSILLSLISSTIPQQETITRVCIEVPFKQESYLPGPLLSVSGGLE